MMKQRTILSVCLLLLSLTAMAQSSRISGTLTDKDTKEAVSQATVQVLKRDSSFVGGALSDDNGRFTVKVSAAGTYILRISSVGYTTLYRNVSVEKGKNADLGTIAFKADAVTLQGTTVTAVPPKVVMQKDTMVFNSAAYRTPEGSVVEELVKRLPGATVDDEGNITINGKKVNKVLVDGKEFMTGDTKTALKNIPTSVIEKIKSYDEKSDLARVTGIDDGNEQTVLDFGLKRGMNKGMFSNVDLGIGNHDRYTERGMAAYFKDKFRVFGFGNANNVGDRGFGGRGGRFGAGQNGLNANKMLGLNFNYEDKNKLKLNGSVRWNHDDGDRNVRNSAENYVSSVGSFSNSLSQNYTRSNSWNAQMRLEWMPDTMTNIMFRPSFSYSTSDGRSWNNSASFSEDPYNTVENPLASESLSTLASNGLVVNSRQQNSLSYTDSKRFGGMLQYNRKLNSMGRNFTLRFDGSYTDGNSKSLSTNNVHLYQVKDQFGNDSTYQTNRYNLAPTKSWSYSAQTTYSEPLWKATFLQFSYKFTYSFNKSDRSTYDFSNLGEDFFSGITPIYRQWGSYLDRLSKPYEEYRDEQLSKYSEYKNYSHNIEVMFRMIRQKYQLSAGVMMQPQRSNFIQNYQGRSVDTTRTVTNFAPSFDFRYRFSDVSNLRINYRGSSTQPSISDMVDITDDSDPLFITKGNPGLKPSFNHRMMAFYDNYIQNHFQFIRGYFFGNITQNGFSNMITYDEKTGGRTSQMQNINGNWNVSTGFTYNVALDTAGVWNINTSTDYSYNNMVSYLNQNQVTQKNKTRDQTIAERLAASFRNSWLEIEFDGSMNYRRTRNLLQSQSNQDVWSFAYGANIILTAPWGMSLATDLHENSRRGYSDNDANTNELVWKAQISQGFLRG